MMKLCWSVQKSVFLCPNCDRLPGPSPEGSRATFFPRERGWGTPGYRSPGDATVVPSTSSPESAGSWPKDTERWPFPWPRHPLWKKNFYDNRISLSILQKANSLKVQHSRQRFCGKPTLGPIPSPNLKGPGQGPFLGSLHLSFLHQ